MKIQQKRSTNTGHSQAQTLVESVGETTSYGKVGIPVQLKQAIIQRVWLERINGKISEREDPRPPGKHKAFNGVMHKGVKGTVWEPKGPPPKTNKEKMDSYPKEGTFEVDAADVMFSQDSISKQFTDGTSYDATISKFKRDGGYIVSDTLKPLRVFKGKNDRLVSLDNRRLYCAKEAGIKVKCVWATEEQQQKDNFKLTSGKGTEGKSTIIIR